MSLGSALSNAISGMTTAQTLVQIRSHNVANALTEGYVRRDAVLEPGTTGGVRVIAVTDAVDGFLRADRLGADAAASDAGARSAAIGEMARVLGADGLEDGLFAAFTRFETAIDDLAATPESTTVQSSALGAAKDLALTFNAIGERVTSLRTEADREIAARVDDVNRALGTLEDLNRVAGRGGVNGLDGTGEQRRAAIDTIAANLDIVVTEHPNGQVRIRTAEGVTLLGETAQPLSFRTGAIATPGTSIASGHLSGLEAGGIDLTPGSGAQSIVRGGIAAQFAVRDELAVEFGTRIDAMADDLVARFGDAATDPTATGGEGLFVTNGTGPGSSSRLHVAASVDPAAGGALWRLRDGVGAGAPGPVAGTGVTQGLQQAMRRLNANEAATGSLAAMTMGDSMAALSSHVGSAKIDAAATAASTGSMAQGLRDAELAITGVDTDQELQSLLLIEQAYAANARVIQAVDDMMARLMEI